MTFLDTVMDINCIISYCQMVMEFSDSVMDVDEHEINTYHWKQFSEVRSLNFIHSV